MKARTIQDNLVARQKDLMNLIYAVCMSFCELKMSDDAKALIRDNRATAKLWFPAGVYEIVQVYENNDIRNPDMILGSVLSIIGSIAKNKYSDFPLFQKTFRNRSLETNQFYSIVSQLGKSGDDWHIIDIEIMEKVKNQLNTAFTNIEVINFFFKIGI